MNTVVAAGTGLFDLFDHAFIRNAFLAGTGIAAASGLVGYFVVLRAQVFSGDALSHVAYTGALAALAFGVDARLGLFVATVAVGIGLGLLGPRGRPDEVVIGTVFTWVLGIGVLLLAIFTTTGGAGDGAASVNVLFGSVFGLDASQAAVAAGIGLGVCVVTVALARPLLFASLDEAVAGAHGVPVRALGIGFLALVGVCAAEATQAVGALLLLGLLAAPAGAALRLTSRPFSAFWLSGALAVLAVWLGIVLSYLVPDIPPSFATSAVATATFGGALVLGPRRDRRRGRPQGAAT